MRLQSAIEGCRLSAGGVAASQFSVSTNMTRIDDQVSLPVAVVPQTLLISLRMCRRYIMALLSIRPHALAPARYVVARTTLRYASLTARDIDGSASALTRTSALDTFTYEVVTEYSACI